MTDQSTTEDVQPTSTRVQGDSKVIVKASIFLVVLLAVVSFTAGIPGLVEVGHWAGLTGVLTFLVPAMLDGGLLVFGLVAVVRRARHEKAVFAWSWLTILTTASVTAQVAHVFVINGFNVTVEAIVGAAVAALFPLVVFAATHSLLDVAVAPPPSVLRKRPTVRKPASTTTKPATAASPRKQATERGPSKGSPVYAPEAVDRAVELYRSGMTQKAAADAAGVSRWALRARLEKIGGLRPQQQQEQQVLAA